MKRATTFLVEKVSTNGGFVWNYLPTCSAVGRTRGPPDPDRIQRLACRDDGDTCPGRVSRDERRVLLPGCQRVAAALIWAQHPSGGWNYLADFGGDRSLR
jgi:hypothetical protein